MLQEMKVQRDENVGAKSHKTKRKEVTSCFVVLALFGSRSHDVQHMHTSCKSLEYIILDECACLHGCS